MSVLVAYATRHGATRGIAERIAERLRAAGLDAEARSAADVRDAARYDAYVVGGAAYMFHWLKDATTFVEKNRALLAERPTWLFSSGPVGTDTVDKQGRDVLETTVPKEFAGLTEAFGWTWGDLEWVTVNAMKSAFAPFDERLRMINERIKPRYAALKAAAIGISAAS
jgi:hypothetical protein